MRALRLLCTITAAALMLAAVAVLPAGTAFECGDSYTFFVGDTSKSCREVTVTERAALTKLLLADVCGEATAYSRLDVEEFLKSVNGRVVFTETLCDSQNFYCTADLPYSINLYGHEINLHVSVRKEGVTVASPIIFGGY